MHITFCHFPESFPGNKFRSLKVDVWTVSSLYIPKRRNAGEVEYKVCFEMIRGSWFLDTLVPHSTFQSSFRLVQCWNPLNLHPLTIAISIREWTHQSVQKIVSPSDALWNERSRSGAPPHSIYASNRSRFGHMLIFMIILCSRNTSASVPSVFINLCLI